MSQQESDFIKITDELKKYQILAEENEYRYTKMKDEFLKLVEQTKIYRERLGYDNRDWEYDIMEASGLLDDYE